MRRRHWVIIGLTMAIACAFVSALVADSDARSPVRDLLNVPVAVPGAPSAKLDIYAPEAREKHLLPVLVWIHGGGFISGSAQQVLVLSPALTHAGFIIASVDYTLAPERRYPTQLDQASAALAYVRTHARSFGADPNRIFVGGDSAGAQIASELAAIQTNPRLAALAGLKPVDEHLRGVVLYSGLYDMRTVGRDRLARLNTFLTDYTGTAGWSHQDQLSTVRWVTRRYPPAFISDATRDPFYPQSTELARAIRRAGASVDFRSWRGLHHDFQLDYTRPAARASLRRTIQFLQRHSAPN